MKLDQKMNEICKTFKHTTVLEINTNREWFTLRGLHLNGLGKQILSKQVVSENYTLLKGRGGGGGRKAEIPVSLEGKKDLTEGTTTQVLENTNKGSDNNQMGTSYLDITVFRTSYKREFQ
jgi:hypothetical protein